MRLTKSRIFFGILVFVLVVNLLTLFNIDQFYFRAIFSFVFLITVPGLLLMLMLKIREINPWEYLVYTIGLSIAFLMFGGLFVNWVLPSIGIDKPLLLMPLLISFDIFLMIFLFIAYKRNKEIYLEIHPPKLSNLNKFFFIILLIFPTLSILGAITLNNGGPNYLMIIMIAGIALYVLMVVLYRNKLNKNIYPFSILIITISLLLAVSLRSWYASGWDIFQEYYVFQLTRESFIWNMSSYPDAYNACLSITILPTVLSSFLKINDQYIYKVLFQLIFAFISVGVFLFLRRFARDIIAFIASFFFISQLGFFASLPKEVRQEIALLFFALTLLILFNKNINAMAKNILFLAFGFSMIVSHYTTSYITLAFFIFTYLLCFIFRKTESKKFFSKIYERLNLTKKGSRLGKRKQYLSVILIIALIIFSFIWYAQVTKISTDLINLAQKTIQNMGKTFSSEMREKGLSFNSQWNIFYKQEDETPRLKDYIKDIKLEYENKQYMSLYPPEKYGDYSPKLIDSENVPPKINVSIVSNIYVFMEIIKKIMKVFLIVGIFYLFFFQLKKRKIDFEYIFLCLIGFFGILAMLIIPYVTLEYSLERFYQQTLIFISLLAVSGSSVIFKFLKEKYRILIVLIIILFYYLFFSGFIPQIIGGSDASLWLNNYGESYDVHYSHRTEVISAKWLQSNWDNKNLVYADRLAAWRLLAFGKFTLVFDDVLPTTIDRNSYVYLRYSNVVKNQNYKRYKNKGLTFNYPIEFLNQNKNLIYSNGESKIFK